MITFTDKDKKELYNNIEELIYNDGISDIIKLYNDEMFADSQGFIDFSDNFVNRLQEGTKNGIKSFPYKFYSDLDFSTHDYIWTDSHNVIHGATFGDFTSILLDWKFINTIINHLIEYNDVNYFRIVELNNWLACKFFVSQINNGDIVVFKNGNTGIYIAETDSIIDFSTVSDIVNNQRRSIIDTADFELDGKHILCENYDIVKIIDIKTHEVKWQR